MKKSKISILIICAVLAANLAACALPGGKTPADVEDGGTAEETMISSEASTQDKVPQRSDDARGRMMTFRSGAVKKLRRRSIFCWIQMLCWMKITS